MNGLLKERKISQARMSKDLGLVPSTLSDWTQGRRDARLRNVVRVCRYLQISLRSFAEAIGIDVTSIPLDVELTGTGIPQFFELAKKQGVSPKNLAKSLGINVEGIPDD